MGKQRFLAICLIIGAALIPTKSPGARPDQLGALNFNLYPKPCSANEMALRDLSGGPVSLASLRGKVVILNFWKIDCIPCAAEKAILERIYRKYGPRGLAVLSVNLFDNYDRMREYVGQRGFSFTFAYDPEKRYSAQTQTLRSGMPTCFVINANADAIYEIPVVPTTYVVNRDGQIIGHSFGMINWDQAAFMDLLESLLGSPTQMLAQAPPRQTAPPQQTPTAVTDPLALEPSPKREFTSEVTPRFPSGPASAGPSPSQSARQPASIAPEQRPSPSSPRGGTSKRTEAPSVGRRDASTRTPLPKSATSTPSPAYQPTPAAQPVSPGSAYPNRAYGPDTPPRSGSSAPSAAIAAPMPPATLPPALPYAPQGTQPSSTGSLGSAPRAQRPAPPVEADREGYVMARVPGQAASKGTEQQRVRPASAAPTPAVIPVERQDSFNRLVLDSFGPNQSRSVPRQAAPPLRSSGQSDWSLAGQMNKIRTGIRDAFTRSLPGR